MASGCSTSQPTKHALQSPGCPVLCHQATTLGRAHGVDAGPIVVVHEHTPVCERLRLHREEKGAPGPCAA